MQYHFRNIYQVQFYSKSKTDRHIKVKSCTLGTWFFFWNNWKVWENCSWSPLNCDTRLSKKYLWQTGFGRSCHFPRSVWLALIRPRDAEPSPQTFPPRDRCEWVYPFLFLISFWTVSEITMGLLSRLSGFLSLSKEAHVFCLGLENWLNNKREQSYTFKCSLQNTVSALGSTTENSNIQFVFTARSGQERPRNLWEHCYNDG